MKDVMASLSIPRAVSLLLIIPLSLFILTYLLPYPSYLNLSFHAPCGALAASASLTDVAEPPAVSEPPPEIRLLMGVFTLPDKYHRRHLLRMSYAVQQPDVRRARVDVRFIFCNLTTDEQRVFVALEALSYGDIIVLDCAENMNNGKTYTYFSSLPSMLANDTENGGGPPYDYVIKADDDAYFRLGNLVEALRGRPREDMYFGLGYKEMSREYPPYMVGMGYVLSWDLVEYVATAEIARRDHKGIEDIWMGMWLNTGGRGRNRVNAHPAMYDFGGPLPEHFLPAGTIAVHLLKDDWRWAVTLRHFNATAGLKPSKLYHIP